MSRVLRASAAASTPKASRIASSRQAESCRFSRRRATIASGSVGSIRRTGPGPRLALVLVAVGRLVAALLARLGGRRTQEVAEAGPGIRRAELGHRLLVLVDLLGLDREREPPRGAVDLRDLGVDLLTQREAIRPLFAALARQIGLADEAGDTVGG